MMMAQQRMMMEKTVPTTMAARVENGRLTVPVSL
jgi:hypothetical protein